MLVGVLALSAAEPLAMRKLRVLVLLVSRSLLLLLGVWVISESIRFQRSLKLFGKRKTTMFVGKHHNRQ